jgi:glycosyltransferase involved in cell wall biosynthesis
VTDPRARHPAPKLVSVVVPSTDVAALPRQLKALARQSITGEWEVVIVDNTGTGAIAHSLDLLAVQLPNARVVRADEHRGACHTRNVGAASAAGDFLAYCDDDDEVDTSWLEAMVDAARYADMVGGPVDYGKLNHDRVASGPVGHRDKALRTDLAFLPWVVASNCGIWHSVLDAVGGWNEDYPRCTDIELSWRVQLAAYKVGPASGAVVNYQFRPTVWQAMKQAFGWGVAYAHLYRDFHAAGLRRTRLRRVARLWARLALRLPDLFRGPALRGQWLRHLAERLGRVAGSVRYRVLFL